MKIAFMFSGLNRANTVFYDNHKKLMDIYNPDIFISTYENNSDEYLDLTTVYNLYRPIILDVENFNDISQNFIDISDKIIWKPKQLEVKNPINTCSMFYKIQRCFDIIKDKYDVYVRLRFDSTFDINTFKIQLNNFLNLPRDGKFTGESDQFAFGNYENMYKYCHIYDRLNDYVINDGLFHPETIVKNMTLSQNKIYHNITYYLNTIKIPRYD